MCGAIPTQALEISLAAAAVVFFGCQGLWNRLPYNQGQWFSEGKEIEKKSNDLNTYNMI